MESNKNTEVLNEDTSDANEPLQKSGGETAVSFDELESLHERLDKTAKSAKTDSSEKTAKTKEDTKVETASKESKETDSVEGKEAAQDTNDKVPGEKKELKKEEKVPTYKVKQGEQTLDLRDDALVKIKVNDKLVEVPFKEIRENYAGKVAWNRKFEEVAKKDKVVTENAQIFTKAVGEITETMKSDPYTAFLKTAEYGGLDKNEVQKQFLAQVLDAVEKLQKMSPEEKVQYEKDLEVQKYKSKADAYEQRDRQLQERQRLESEIAAQKQENELSDKEFVGAYEELVALKANRQLSQEITPSVIASFASEKRLYTTVKNFLGEIDESLIADDENVEEMVEVARNFKGKLSLAQLKDIAVEVYGSDKAKNLNKKIKKAEPTDTSKPSKKAALNANQDLWSFDQL